MNAHDAYLESRILTADPLELIRVLYRGAVESVEDARQALRAGDIPRRTRGINRGIEIITELTLSLERAQENGIALNLAELYDYMQRRLLEAHFQQTEPPLAEVNGLLKTLLEGWEQCRPEPASAPAATAGCVPDEPYPAFTEELSEHYASLSCSY